jgi:hypothetical protein
VALRHLLPGQPVSFRQHRVVLVVEVFHQGAELGSTRIRSDSHKRTLAIG